MPKTTVERHFRKRLRILLDPIYVQVGNLGSSSTYNKYVSLCRELVSRGHYVFWCIPDAPEYIPNEIENHPQVGIIRTAYIQDQFVVDGIVSNDFFNLFNRVGGKYHIDVLVTSRNSVAMYYRRLLEPPRFHDVDTEYTDKGYGLPVVLLEEFPQTRKRQHVGRAYWLNQCLGYLTSDTTVFLSGHNCDEVVEEMKDTFLTSQISHWLKDQVRVIPAGIETAELDKIYEADRWKAEKGFNVVSIGRLMGVSHVEYLPWFDYLFKSGISDCTLTLSLSGNLSGPMRSKLEGIGFDLSNFGKQFKLFENNPRKNFLRMLRRFHCAVAPMSHLDHPTAIFEALYLGLPVIMPVADYQQTFFKDYPFVIEPKDKAGLLAMLLWIRENPAEARAKILPWRDIIRDKYDAPKNIKLLADVIEADARRAIDTFKTSNGVLNLCKEFKGKVYTWGDVVEYLRKAGWLGVSIGNMGMRQTFTYARSAIHHAMHLAGFSDPCDGPQDRFIRNDVFDEKAPAPQPVKSPAPKLPPKVKLS